MFDAIWSAFRGMLNWLHLVVWALLGSYTSRPLESGTHTFHVWETGFEKLLPLFCIGIAASIIMFSTKIVRKACNRL